MKLLKSTKMRLLLIALIILLIAALLAIQFWIVDITSKPTAKIREACKIEEKYYENRKIFIITPKKGIKNDRVILYLHGGSYVAEMSKKHWGFVEDLVEDTGSTLILPDYPLTPKYQYTDVFNMIFPVYKKVIEKVGSNRLVVMGDSAGGGMSLALCEVIAENQIPLPDKLILISPWLDATLSNEKIDEIQKEDKQLNKEVLKMAGVTYAGKNGIETYLVNPINGPLEKLKNLQMVIYTGTYDILNPDVSILKEKAQRLELELIVKEYEKQEHVWVIERGKEKTKEAEEAYQDLVTEALTPGIQIV